MAILIIKTAAEFLSDNTLLTKNQIGQESDTGLMKTGYGNWNALDYNTPVNLAFEQILSGSKTKVPSSFAVKTYVDAAVAGAGFITAILDTNGVDLTVSAGTLTADLRIQNTATVNLTVNAGGLKADFASMDINQFTGQLTLSRGGTNANLTASLGGIFYSTATAGAILSGTATAGQMLRSGASAAPTWSTATYPDTVVLNQILYGTALNVVGGSANLTFDGTTVRLGVGTASVIGTSTYFDMQLPLGAGILVGGNTAGHRRVQIFQDSSGYACIQGFGATDGSAKDLTMQPNGGSLIVGAQALVGTEFVSIQKSQNAASKLSVINTNSGASASTQYQLINDASNVFAMALYSSGVATSSYIGANNTAISCSAGDLGFVNVGSGNIKFWVNNTTNAAIINSSGQVGIGLTPTVLLDVGKNQNAATSIRVTNSTSGASSIARLYAQSSSTFSVIDVYSATTTAYGASTANSATFYANNKLVLMADDASNGVISFAAGGNGEDMRVTTAGELLIGYSTLIGAEVLGVQRNQNLNSDIRLTNTTSGTTAQCRIVMAASTANLVFGAQSATFTTSAMEVQNHSTMRTTAGGGLDIGCSNNAGLDLWTNATKRISILATGEVLCGYSALTGQEILGAKKAQNANTDFNLENGTSGTASEARILIRSSNATAVFTVSSATYTTSGMRVQDSVIIESNTGTGLNVGTRNSAPIAWWTNNTKVGTMTVAGVLKIAGVATRATTEGTNHLDIFDGTAPVGTLANGISLYSTAGELRVMDAAGNATLLSPHEKNTNYWIYDSVDTVKKKRLVIDMEKMMRTLNDKFGFDFVHDFVVK